MKDNLWNALVHPDRIEKLHIPDSVADANLKAWRYRRRYEYIMLFSSYVVFEILTYIFRETPSKSTKWLVIILLPSIIVCICDAAYNCYSGFPDKSDVGTRNLIGLVFCYFIGIMVFWLLLYTLKIFEGPNGTRLSFLAGITAGTAAALFVYADMAIIYHQYLKRIRIGVTDKQILVTKVIFSICTGVLVVFFLALFLYPLLSVELEDHTYQTEVDQINRGIESYNNLNKFKIKGSENIQYDNGKIETLEGTVWSSSTSDGTKSVSSLWDNEVYTKDHPQIVSDIYNDEKEEMKIYIQGQGWVEFSDLPEDNELLKDGMELYLKNGLLELQGRDIKNISVKMDGDYMVYTVLYKDNAVTLNFGDVEIEPQKDVYWINKSNILEKWILSQKVSGGSEEGNSIENREYRLLDYNSSEIEKEIEEFLKK